jgi:hypothetical protein
MNCNSLAVLACFHGTVVGGCTSAGLPFGAKGTERRERASRPDGRPGRGPEFAEGSRTTGWVSQLGSRQNMMRPDSYTKIV